MPRALSRNARALLARCLSGEEIEPTSGVISARRELERAGLLEEGSTRPTRAALRRRREFLPHEGPLSKAAVTRFRRHLAGDRDVTDANRSAYRELAAAGLMEAMHSFAGGDESVYRLTKEGFELAGMNCAEDSAGRIPGKRRIPRSRGRSRFPGAGRSWCHHGRGGGLGASEVSSPGRRG